MLRDDINNAVKDAMRAKEERKLSTLRMVNSTIKNADIAARGEGKPPLSDADLLGVFQKMIKQRQESVELYDKGGRAELAAAEREEIAIISAYLPKQMSEADVKAAISAAIAETGAGRDEGHGQGDRRLEGEIRRPDGFRQGQRHGEGGAFLLALSRLRNVCRDPHCCWRPHAQHRSQHRRDPVSAPEERQQVGVPAPDTQPEREHHSHAECRGASSSTDNTMRTSVASDRAQLVTRGVNSPAATSVDRSAATLRRPRPVAGPAPRPWCCRAR